MTEKVPRTPFIGNTLDMGLFVRPDSPWYWMLLEGTGRKKERIPIRHDASDPDTRKLNRDAAEAIYHARMVQLAKQRAGLPIDTGRTFKAHAEWFDRHVISTHRSARAERSILAGLVAAFGPLRLADIRPARVQEYASKRLEKRKRSTVNQSIRLLKAILKSAEGEHIGASPLSGYRQRQSKSRPKRTVEAHEEAALLAALTALDPELHDAYVVAVGTLLRQENVILLKRSQHRGDRLVVETKTGPHVVSLTGPTELQTRAAAVLKARWPSSSAAPFFPTWAKRFTDASTTRGANARLLGVFKQAIETAGLTWGLDQDGLVWHSATRATGATRLIRDYGIDIRTVQMMGPWSSLDQMAVYLGMQFGHGPGTDTAKS